MSRQREPGWVRTFGDYWKNNDYPDLIIRETGAVNGCKWQVARPIRPGRVAHVSRHRTLRDAKRAVEIGCHDEGYTA